MSESRRKDPAASVDDRQPDPDEPAGEARVPRPLNSAGRPVDGSGRPVGDRHRPAGDARRGEPRGERRRTSARSGDEAREPPGSPADEWERIRTTFGAGAGPGPPTPDGSSLGALVALLEAVRAMVPQELERQFAALLREVLLTLRALIDWYLERLDGGERERRVEDIPIE